MKYKYNITGIINAEGVDDALDILTLTLQDITSTCEVNVSDEHEEASKQ